MDTKSFAKRMAIRAIVVLLLAAAWLLYSLWYETRPGAGRVEQKINCVNNLKQIGLAFRIWSGDHGDKYPFQISTNAGGTRELCAPDRTGFDSNSYLHFKAMAGGECLSIPLLLICPQDRTKHAATNWAKVAPENVTYRLRTSTDVNEDNPKAILAVCPVDGNILYCDDTVSSAPK